MISGPAKHVNHFKVRPQFNPGYQLEWVRLRRNLAPELPYVRSGNRNLSPAERYRSSKKDGPRDSGFWPPA